MTEYGHEILPQKLQEAREQLGWGRGLMGRALRLGRWWDEDDPGPKTRVRDLESGRRVISGPVAVAVAAFLAGFRPDHIDWDDKHVSDE